MLEIEYPHDELAERAVLGGMIARPELIAKALNEELSEEDFYFQEHKKLWALLKGIFSERGIEWDDILFFEFAEKKRVEVNRVLFYALVEEGSTSDVLFESALERIKELSTLRKIRNVALELLKEKELEGVKKRIGLFEEIFKETKTKTKALSELLSEVYENVKVLRARDRLITGAETGFTGLDLMTGGFQKGHLVVVGARPGMGKSSFMLSLALHMAKKGIRVGIFSLEMTAEELTQRMLSMESKIMLKKLRTGQITDEEFEVLTQKAIELRRLSVWINDRADMTPLDLRIELRKNSTDVVFVDYLQLLKSAEKYYTRQEEVSRISQSLKAMAKDFGVCVIALAQLNRQVEQRADKRPNLSDLRESGAIEQDADIVMFLHRPEYYRKNAPENQGRAEIILAKNRHGPTGTVVAFFDAETTAFRPIQSEQEQRITEDREELEDEIDF